MKQPAAETIAVHGTDYTVKIPSLVNQTFYDPTLIGLKPGEAWPPQALSVLGSGATQRIIYRWWTDAGLITLSLGWGRATGRHRHQPRFAVVQDNPAEKIERELTVQSWVLSDRPAPLWHQDADSLATDIARTQVLQERVRSWLAALSLGKV